MLSNKSKQLEYRQLAFALTCSWQLAISQAACYLLPFSASICLFNGYFDKLLLLVYGTFTILYYCRALVCHIWKKLEKHPLFLITAFSSAAKLRHFLAFVQFQEKCTLAGVRRVVVG